MNVNSPLPCLLVLLLHSGTVLADDGELYLPNEQQRQKILAGEVISIPVHTDEKGGTVWGAIRIDAPARDIFNSIVYCNGKTSAHKTMRNCKTIEKDAEHEIAEHQIKYHWLVPRQKYLFRGDYTGFTRIRFRVLEGDLKKLDGGWDLFPIENTGAYLVRYYATIQPRLPTPKWLIRKSLKKEIPAMLKVMKELSENPARLVELDATEARRLEQEAQKKAKRR